MNSLIINKMYDSSWKYLFENYNVNINFLDELCKKNKYYPAKEYIFRVFEMPIDKIEVVLLGQDPYHQPNQAHGLSFSVEKNIKIPPSLINIFKELKLEFPERKYDFTHGSLEKWHKNGIFLLNCALTVEEGKPLSHMNLWKDFTDDVIRYISKKNKKCVFLLLGNFAKSKKILIDDYDRCVEGIHPSPLAKGFIGSYIFKQVENKLGINIDWSN